MLINKLFFRFVEIFNKLLINKLVFKNTEKDVEIRKKDEGNLKKEIDEYTNSLKRWISTKGINLKTIELKEIPVYSFWKTDQFPEPHLGSAHHRLMLW